MCDPRLVGLLRALELQHLAPSFAEKEITLDELRLWDLASLLALPICKAVPAARLRRLHAAVHSESHGRVDPPPLPDERCQTTQVREEVANMQHNRVDTDLEGLQQRSDGDATPLDASQRPEHTPASSSSCVVGQLILTNKGCIHRLIASGSLVCVW